MMIDIHSHILPVGDDGSDNLTEAVQLAQLAVAEGVTELVATPHHRNGIWNAEREKVERLVEKVQEKLVENHIPLKIHPGQEIRLHDELFSDIEQDRVLFIDPYQKYLLLELPFRSLPENAVDVVKKLVAQKVTPIIAHPERNQVIAQNSDLLVPLIESGAVTQLTAGSYIGEYGKAAYHSAKDLVARDLIDLFASDAHNTVDRPFYWSEFFEAFLEDYSEEYLDEKLKNAERIMAGQVIIRSKKD